MNNILNETFNKHLGYLKKKLITENFHDSEELSVDDLNSISEITDSVKDKMVSTAQKVYDSWKQDERGYDSELGRGGICHLIADKLISALYSSGINNVQSVCSSFEQHVYVIGAFKEGVYSIDIPYHIYEKGAAFTWKKLPDIVFDRGDVSIDKIDSDFNNLNQYIEQY